jgi:rod shape-determining protein MreC
MSYQPPPFFSRGPAPLVRLGFFVSLAVLLMVLDARFRYAESVREAVALLAYPLQRVALAPAELLGSASEFFTTQVALKQENEQLRAKDLHAASDLLTLESLRAENAQLRRLLDARERIPRTATLAEILYRGRDPFSRKVVIDKGSRQGVEPGQAVIDDIGVIGQVTRVHPFLAEVTLITDKEQRTPVEVVRNGLRAVIYGGSDKGTLDLSYTAANADVQARCAGDLGYRRHLSPGAAGREGHQDRARRRLLDRENHLHPVSRARPEPAGAGARARNRLAGPAGRSRAQGGGERTEAETPQKARMSERS